MIRYVCRYYAAVCCHTFDGIGYLEELQRELLGSLEASGFRSVSVRAAAAEENGRARRDLPAELEVLAEGERAALERETEKVLSSVSAKYRLSVTVFSRSAEEDEAAAPGRKGVRK